MYVEFWTNTKGKMRVIAVIRADGQIEEKEPLPPRIREDIEDQRRRVPGKRFLESLPAEFSGSYYWAILKD